VPLRECNKPTLIPSPAGAAGDAPEAEGDGLPEALGAVAVGALGVQALSNTLPAAVEPRINISRRRNLRAMNGTHSMYFVFRQGNHNHHHLSCKNKK
jgi:hypothetical protein